VLVSLFGDNVLLSVWVIAKRDDANRSVFVSFCDKVISAAIKQEVIIKVVDE